MKGMFASMGTIVNSVNYKLAKIVLSKTRAFSLEELVKDVQTENLQMDKDRLRKALNRFRDNGIIIEHGSCFSVVPSCLR